MSDLDIPVGHTPSRREAYELRTRLADTLCGLGVTDLYAVDVVPPARGRRRVSASCSVPCSTWREGFYRYVSAAPLVTSEAPALDSTSECGCL